MLAGVHLSFVTYDKLEESADPSEALEALLETACGEKAALGP